MKFENILNTLKKLDFEEAITYLVGAEEMTRNDPKTNEAIKLLVLNLVEE